MVCLLKFKDKMDGCEVTIVAVDMYLVDLMPPVKRSDAIQSFTKQETVVLSITDSTGLVGSGFTYSIGTAGRAVYAHLEHDLLDVLLGADPRNIEALWKTLYFKTHATTPGAVTASAMCAVDTALWDMRCKRAGVPLWRLAGGAKPCIDLYDTEGGWLHLSPGEVAANAAASCERGIAGVKIKVGSPHVSDDVARLRAVRDALSGSPRFDVMVDANQAWTVPEAIRRAKAYEPFGLAWLEEPLPADDVEGHARLCASTTIPIAVGESLYTIGQFRDYLQRGACSVVQPDVGRVGGITPWLKVAHMAEAFNIPVAPHYLMEIHAQLVCAVPNSMILEHFTPAFEAITTKSPIAIRDGKGYPSEDPGIGFAWDMDAIQRLAVLPVVHKAV